MYWPNHAAFSWLDSIWHCCGLARVFPCFSPPRPLKTLEIHLEYLPFLSTLMRVTHQNCPLLGLGSERRAEITFNRQKQMRR